MLYKTILGKHASQPVSQMSASFSCRGIIKSDLKSSFTADQHGQFPRTRQAGIEQVALQKHKMLGNNGHDHSRIFAALRFVNTHRIGKYALPFGIYLQAEVFQLLRVTVSIT